MARKILDLDGELQRILMYVDACGIDILDEHEKKLYFAFKKATDCDQETLKTKLFNCWEMTSFKPFDENLEKQWLKILMCETNLAEIENWLNKDIQKAHSRVVNVISSKDVAAPEKLYMFRDYEFLKMFQKFFTFFKFSQKTN